MDRIYKYNPDVIYKPNGGIYLQIMSAKDLYIQNVTVAEHTALQKVRFPKKMKQIEMYVDEIDDNTKQFALVLNELPTTSEDNQDNIMLQDIITKNEIATGNSMKLIETSLTEIGEDGSTQTGGLTLREA